MGRAARRFYLAIFALFGAVHTQSPPRRVLQVLRDQPISHDPNAFQVDPNAIVSDACASYSTLDDLNRDLQPILHSLTHDSDFFSYYRLNLYDKVCPFWNDESGMCGNIACAVYTIDNEEDVPAIWRADELGKLEGPKAHHPARVEQKKERPLMGELGADVGESCVVEYDDDCDERDYCVPEDESAASKGDYVSLLDNPERFTGYGGPSAHQVWEAIYDQNCFTNVSSSAEPQAASELRSVLAHDPSGETELSDSNSQCLEKRTFYRVISGMHASISTHLCYDYLNQTTGEWGPNLACYVERLHAHPDRISNLYFNYALVLRAIGKVRNALSSYTFCSGDPDQDRATKSMVLSLSDAIISGPKIYDESMMFRDSSIVGLKDDFRNRFRNVSRTMDCVGCDKCRLWGKLQTAGYGTALKILFEFDENAAADQNPPLRRTELVALVNTLDRISHSLSAIGKFEQMLHGSGGRASGVTAGSVDARAAEVIDDGFPDKEETVHEEEDATMEELMLIWNTTKWVMAQWINLPTTIFKIIVISLSGLWDFWLGRGTTIVTGIRKVWEVQYPPGVPEATQRVHNMLRHRDEI